MELDSQIMLPGDRNSSALGKPSRLKAVCDQQSAIHSNLTVSAA
jgi:hypothetical protein